jgi:hypothetical protein
VSEHGWRREHGRQLQAASIHPSRVPRIARNVRLSGRFAELVDAFSLLVRNGRLGPNEQRPTRWLGEPPRLVVAGDFAADRFVSRTEREAARLPDEVLEPTQRDIHSRAARQPPKGYREVPAEGCPVAGDALRDLDRWDERDNVITCADVDAAAWQLHPPHGAPTSSTPRHGQATRSSRIAEFRSDPTTWIVVGLGAPTYSQRDPRLSVATAAARSDSRSLGVPSSTDPLGTTVEGHRGYSPDACIRTGRIRRWLARAR